MNSAISILTSAFNTPYAQIHFIATEVLMQAQARVRTPQIALTVITALIHFESAVQDPDIRILFILNGLGYFALLAAFYMPAFQKLHNLVRWTFIVYAAVTILLYFVWVAISGEWTIPLGPIAKIVEAAMIVILLREP